MRRLAWAAVLTPLVGLRVAGQALEFLSLVVLARRLGSTEFGVFAVAFLLCRYAGLVADWGASITGARDVAAERSANEINALVRRRYVLTAMLSLGYLACVLVFSWPFLAPLVFVIASRGLNRDWLALGRERSARSGIPTLVQGALMLAGAMLVRAPEHAAVPAFLGYGAAAAVSLSLNRLPPATTHDRPRVQGWVVLSVLADQVTASTDTVMLAALRSAAEAGVYAAVYRIPNAWVTLIGLAVMGMVPAAARELSRSTALKQLMQGATRTGLLWGAVVVLTIPPAYALVPVLFGAEYTEGRGPLVVLMLATAVIAVAAPLHPVYFALRRDRRLASISCAAAALNVVMNLVLIPVLGMAGAAISTLAAQLTLLVLFRRGVSAALRQESTPSGQP